MVMGMFIVYGFIIPAMQFWQRKRYILAILWPFIALISLIVIGGLCALWNRSRYY